MTTFLHSPLFLHVFSIFSTYRLHTFHSKKISSDTPPYTAEVTPTSTGGHNSAASPWFGSTTFTYLAISPASVNTAAFSLRSVQGRMSYVSQPTSTPTDLVTISIQTANEKQ